METVTLTCRPSPRPVSYDEVLRYASAKGAEGWQGRIDDCLTELAPLLRYGVCYRFFPIEKRNGRLSLGFAETDSETAFRALSGCDGILLFAATLGQGLDRLLSRYGRLSPTRALLLQAIGAERIEALCDAFEAEITEELTKEGYLLRPRFSPGYGDLPLTLQRDIFSALGPENHIGLTLNESLLMSPSKSVTAIIGVKKGNKT